MRGAVEVEVPIKEKYRGPPPRKDMIPSPCKERDWKGNDWFNEMSSENQNGHNGNHTEEEKGRVTPPSDVGIAPGLHGDYVDPHLKVQRDYESEYAKLALQGGHKDLLSMSGDADVKIQTTDEMGRRQRGCDNLSEYNKIALRGGHKDLLKISDSTGPASKVKSPPATRSCGDWYGDGSEKNGVADNNNTPTKKPTSPEMKTPIRDQRRGNGNCIVPGGVEEAPRCGKKRFDSSAQRREAPFATYY